MYYFTLLFLLAFTTPVLITTSLNVYITNAVSGITGSPSRIVSVKGTLPQPKKSFAIGSGGQN